MLVVEERLLASSECAFVLALSRFVVRFQMDVQIALPVELFLAVRTLELVGTTPQSLSSSPPLRTRVNIRHRAVDRLHARLALRVQQLHNTPLPRASQTRCPTARECSPAAAPSFPSGRADSSPAKTEPAAPCLSRRTAPAADAGSASWAD